MDAISVTQYGNRRAIEVTGWGDAPGCVDAVERVGVKWALAVLAVLGATLTLMLSPAVVAVISMVDQR
jgi:hypothetical protein